MSTDHIISVTELNQYIKQMLDYDPLLARVFVRGEISNLKLHSSGHIYMTLKDEGGVLRAVMFRGDASKLVFQPENGMKVIAGGRISAFPRDGQYQLYVTNMTPEGVGSLAVAYEQLKQKLYDEGLFDEAHKKPIPRFPNRIAVITSKTGAAVRDILRILGIRWPMAEEIVIPVRVQGEGAGMEVARAIAYANRYKVADLIITGRGGGSIEDLWAFNEECVARAIYASEIPVISAVGHEPDVTISDFVADLRAATPSNAAELAVEDQSTVRATITDRNSCLLHSIEKRLELLKKTVSSAAEKRVLTNPRAYFDDKRMQVEFLSRRMNSAADNLLSMKRGSFVGSAAALDAMSPLKVIARGYLIATEDEKIIKSVEDVSIGDPVSLRLWDGRIDCVVSDVKREDIHEKG